LRRARRHQRIVARGDGGRSGPHRHPGQQRRAGSRGRALKHSEEDWDVVLDTNLKGMFFMARGAGLQGCANAAAGASSTWRRFGLRSGRGKCLLPCPRQASCN
jgi:NAD(P)-dependent dehydrogenase (short-subunit alcohol dehydrogenase family)